MSEKTEIRLNGTYKHRSGMTYRVDELLHDATGYESSGRVTPAVLYTQLGDGSFPKGTRWTRSQEDFRKNFELLK